jgi:hypothetical protein
MYSVHRRKNSTAMKKEITILTFLLQAFLAFGQNFPQYKSMYVPMDHDKMLRIREANDARDSRYNEDLYRRIEDQYNEDKEKSMNYLNQVKAYYNSLNSYPEYISDGYHKVIATNNYDFCEDVKVYVSNNKVSRYYYENDNQSIISFSTTIIKAKSLVNLRQTDGSSGSALELYFLEN